MSYNVIVQRKSLRYLCANLSVDPKWATLFYLYYCNVMICTYVYIHIGMYVRSHISIVIEMRMEHDDAYCRLITRTIENLAQNHGFSRLQLSRFFDYMTYFRCFDW